MQPKDLSTVRVTNISSDLQEGQVRHFFESHGLRTIQTMSLCRSSTQENAPLVATVTLKSPSDAKRALKLNGKALGRLNVSVEREFMGLTVLDAPPDSMVDIVAVHGLNGHAFGTWTCHKEGQADAEAMWLRDFLPAQLRAVRVLIYGYNSALLGPNTSVSTVKDFAFDLLQRILADRASNEEKTRPLIFVCHSLGGIVVKQALVCAHAAPEHYPHIETATRSILFLATPHGGSKSANIGSLLAKVTALALQRPSKQLLNTLKYESGILTQLSEDFRAIHAYFKIINFYERRKTSILNSLIVDDISARLGVQHELLVPIDANHRDICKFNNQSDPRYLPVLAELRHCVEESINSTRASNGTVLKAESVSEQPGVFLVHLPANPHFLGREAELRLLDEHLRAEESENRFVYPIVAIHGLGGVGKTQLANEYVYERRKRDPEASIFWISARSVEEIEAGFRAIADKLPLARGVEPNISRDSSQYPSNNGEMAVGNTLDQVTNWMCAPAHKGWLLVLDNYDDITMDIRKFLPTDRTGSVLITSRDRKVIGSVATSGFALSALESSDAARLFLNIQGHSPGSSLAEPASQPEYNYLGDILEELQYFPLAIDQAASFMRENSPMTFREYLNYLKPRSADRERLMRFKQANPLYPESIMTTWEISFEFLERTQPRACMILQILGFLDHSYIAEDLLTATTKKAPWIFESDIVGRELSTQYRTDMRYLEDDVGFRVAIGTLASLSLIRRNSAGPTLQVHPLVHEWIRVRLNTEPEKQAKLTVCATLILYQSFPVELVAWVPDNFPVTSIHSTHRVDQVAHHIKSVLQNLRDYQTQAEVLPVECFILCEVLLLAEAPKHLVHPLEVSNEVSDYLDSVIRVMVTQLAQCYQPMAFHIHRVNMWLRSHAWSGGSSRILYKIMDSLEALSFPFPLEDSGKIFLMLLATSVIDISERVEYTLEYTQIGAEKRSLMDIQREESQGEYARKDVARGKQCREVKFRLFNALKRMFSSISPTSPFLQWIIFMINLRLIRTLTPGEFASQEDLSVTQMLPINLLRHLPFNHRAAHLCNIAQVLWDRAGAKDYEGIKTVLSSAMSECKAELRRERRASKEREDREVMLAWSHSSYISSSWGRPTRQSGEGKIKADIIAPLEYIWKIVLNVARAISKPGLRWRTPSSDPGPGVLLSFSQRRWALDLVLGMRKIRGRISSAETSTDTTLLDNFKDGDVNLALSTIYVHLEEWKMLRVCVLDTMKLKEIVHFCESSYPLPWHVGHDRRNWPTELESLAPSGMDETYSKNPQISLSSTGEGPLYIKNEEFAEAYLEAPIPALQERNVELTQFSREVAARLVTTAEQRLSRASASLRKERSVFQQLNVPGSCECITSGVFEAALSASIKLIEKEARVPPEEISNLQVYLSVLQQIRHYPARLLGRLELSYKIARHLQVEPSVGSETKAISCKTSLSRIKELQMSKLSNDASSHDESSGDSTDSFQGSTRPNAAELDWGW